jgi:hypothetical protein
MSEWRMVTKASEVRNGQRVRYYDGKSWDHGSSKCGEDGDPRYYHNGASEDNEGDVVVGDVFDGEFEHVEALFGDAAPTDNLAAARQRIAELEAELRRVRDIVNAALTKQSHVLGTEPRRTTTTTE